jgi:hypothetical protein
MLLLARLHVPLALAVFRYAPEREPHGLKQGECQRLGVAAAGWEAEDEASRTAAALFGQMDLIFSFRPATAAGAAALLKCIATLEEWQMPPGLEESSGMEAVQKLCSCLAAALEQSIVRA